MNVKAILGTKVGMTQVFSKEGRLIAVTAVQVLENLVVAVKTQQKDGFDAVVIGYDEIREKLLSKPVKGQFHKHQLPYKRHLIQLRGVTGYQVGDKLNLSDLFQIGDCVDVQGTSRGHGFTGAIKKWNFSTGPRSHGAGWPHRYQGSLETGRGGAAAQRVWKGKKMAGRYGNETVSVINLEIVGMDLEHQLILIKGALPGRNKSIVRIKTTTRKNKTAKKPFNLFFQNQPTTNDDVVMGDETK